MNQLTTFPSVQNGIYQPAVIEYLFGVAGSSAITDLTVASKNQNWPSDDAESANADWMNILNNEHTKTNFNEAEKRAVIIWDEGSNGKQRDENQPTVSH